MLGQSKTFFKKNTETMMVCFQEYGILLEVFTTLKIGAKTSAHQVRLNISLGIKSVPTCRQEIRYSTTWGETGGQAGEIVKTELDSVEEMRTEIVNPDEWWNAKRDIMTDLHFRVNDWLECRCIIIVSSRKSIVSSPYKWSCVCNVLTEIYNTF